MKLYFRAFIKPEWLRHGVDYEARSETYETYYSGDGRHADFNGDTARMFYELDVDLDTMSTTEDDSGCDYSHEKVVRRETGEIVSYKTDRADESGVTWDATVNSSGNAVITIDGEAGNPFISYAPKINMNFTAEVNSRGNVWVSGTHDGYPAYEIWKKDYGETPLLIYAHNPEYTGDNPYSLIGTGEYSIDEYAY